MLLTHGDMFVCSYYFEAMKQCKLQCIETEIQGLKLLCCLHSILRARHD